MSVPNLPLRGTKEELARAWAAQLQDEFWDPQALEQAATIFIETAGEAIPTSPPRGGLGLLIRRYAIRKDDLKAFECVIAALSAAASAGLFLGHQPFPTAAIGVLTAILKFVWGLRASGVMLDDDKVRVLTILRANISSADPGMTASQILKVVNRVSPGKNLAWVNAQLADLVECPDQSGTIKALVSRNHAGRWRPHV